jgi:hypothetical protein
MCLVDSLCWLIVLDGNAVTGKFALPRHCASITDLVNRVTGTPVCRRNAEGYLSPEDVSQCGDKGANDEESEDASDNCNDISRIHHLEAV